MVVSVVCVRENEVVLEIVVAIAVLEVSETVVVLLAVPRLYGFSCSMGSDETVCTVRRAPSKNRPETEKEWTGSYRFCTFSACMSHVLLGLPAVSQQVREKSIQDSQVITQRGLFHLLENWKLESWPMFCSSRASGVCPRGGCWPLKYVAGVALATCMCSIKACHSRLTFAASIRK